MASVKDWQNEVALVSGASAGIGASVALNLANLGMTVIGLARRNKLIDVNWKQNNAN